MGRKGQAIDGVLLLDKPRDITSNGALQSARRLLGAAKAGHTGTLDPMATGLLPLCFGEATKFSSLLLDASKVYRARITFGIATATGDVQGEVLQRTDIGALGSVQIVRVLEGLIGEQEQVPPMYSALKHAGRPLYEYARAGQQIERASRRIQVYSLEISSVERTDAEIRIEVSKGTYIRSLAEEVGLRLGVGAHLSALRREGVAGFRVEQAVTLDRLAESPPEQRRSWLLPTDALLAGLPRIDLDETRSRKLRQGGAVAVEAPGELVRLYDPSGSFIGVGRAAGEGVVAPQRLLQTTCAKAS